MGLSKKQLQQLLYNINWQIDNKDFQLNNNDLIRILRKSLIDFEDD